jgi:hypothetical protein
MTATHGRRAFLTATAATAASLAGCGQPESRGTATESGGGTDADAGSDTETGDDTDPTGADTEMGTGASSTELDLREANVVGVSVEAAGDARYQFEVTLIHDDDGEDGYADWWQVEALDGTRLGRRELAHAHGTQEFTRSADVEVPGEHACVVVRGHDQTHEYGGQAMLVNVDSGSTAVENPGSEPRSFSETDCPE